MHARDVDALALELLASLPHLAPGEEIVHDGAAVVLGAAELRDVHALEVQAAQGVLDIELQQDRVVAPDLEDDFRHARAVFFESLPHDHERAPAGVFLAGVEGDAAVHGQSRNAHVGPNGGEIVAAAQAHAAEGEGSEREHGGAWFDALRRQAGNQAASGASLIARPNG